MKSSFNTILLDYLRPAGGPSGYLHNLDSSLRENRLEDIQIYCYGRAEKKSAQKNKTRKSLSKKIKLALTPTTQRYRYLINKELTAHRRFYDSISTPLNSAKLNHFHGTNDLYHYCNMFPDSKAITAITSHSPQLPHVELFESLIANGCSYKLAKMLSDRQKEIDTYAFRNADYIIFPCEEATSSYDSYFKEILIDRSKLRYVVTASRPIPFELSRAEFRLRYKIPEETIVLAYVGRLNEIKGYNIYCQSALELKNNGRYLFLSAGTGPVATPQSDNIINFGWTDDPGSILNACDFVVAPNKNTYFDIGIIQALSLGKPVFTTYTGGNRWFRDKDVDMIFIDYDSSSLNREILKRQPNISLKNINFFDIKLDNRHFAKNYLELYQSIVINHRNQIRH